MKTVPSTSKHSMRNAALRAGVLVVITAAATTAVVLPVATAQSPATPTPASTPAPQLVSGLPDFTHLVDQVGPAVVNIEAEIGGRNVARGTQQMPDEEEIPEIFRRFFGPGGMPGMPQGPSGRRGTSMGTGFIISADGYVLTNHHVVEGADTVKVKLSDRREFTAKVVGSDQESDVAVLKIGASGLPALRMGDSKTLKPGQWVVAIGSPFGLDHSVTAGIVSAVGRANPYANQRYVPFIQTDVAINRGNSGGPLLDTRGQVVGINSQIFSNSGGYQGVSFAIPIDVAMNVSQQLRTTGKVERGQLGVGLQPQAIDAEQAQALGLSDTRGALVIDVQPGSAADKAGIQRMDVVRSVNGAQVNQHSDLPPMIGAMAPGSRAKIGIIRDGKPREVDVVLTVLDTAAATSPGAGGRPGAGPQAPARGAAANPLGLVGQDLDADERSELSLRAGEGVGIARVDGLAARSAGIQPGDVVLSVGRTDVGSAAALDRELRAAKAGQTVMLLVQRGSGRQYIAVTPRADGGDDERQ